MQCETHGCMKMRATCREKREIWTWRYGRCRALGNMKGLCLTPVWDHNVFHLIPILLDFENFNRGNFTDVLIIIGYVSHFEVRDCGYTRYMLLHVHMPDSGVARLAYQLQVSCE
jgi:hypothetical protein